MREHQYADDVHYKQEYRNVGTKQEYCQRTIAAGRKSDYPAAGSRPDKIQREQRCDGYEPIGFWLPPDMKAAGIR